MTTITRTSALAEVASLALDQMPVQPTIPVRRVYNVREAATLLGVGKDYVYERINTGEIPIVQLGTEHKSMRRIASEDLDNFINARRVQL